MAGRPRKRSVEEILSIAMKVFWAKGYNDTTIGDLSKAFGVGPSSIYNCFGSKSQLYLKCISSYVDEYGRFYGKTLAHEDVRVGLTEMLQQAAAMFSREDCPKGCAVLSQATVFDDEVESALRSHRARYVRAIHNRLEAAVEQGQIASTTDVASVARYVMAILQGLSQQARDGASTEDLEGLVREASRAFAAL